MPSLRQKVTTYFRQLSFIAEPREGPRSPRKTEANGSFIIKYLEGRYERIFVIGPQIYIGHNPNDLPEHKLGTYYTGSDMITAASTGPDEGLTGIKRSKLHLSASYADDIDFIDTIQESDCFEVRKSISNLQNNKSSRYNALRKQTSLTNTPTNDQNANKVPGIRSRKNSKNNISNLSKTPASGVTNTKNENKSTTIVVSMVSTKSSSVCTSNISNDQNNKNLINAKTEPSTFNKNLNALSISSSTKNDENIQKLLENTTEKLRNEVSNKDANELNNSGNNVNVDSVAGVGNWKMECESAYGISVSLYENNLVTKESIGNPIADCYGIVVRSDAAAIALADGVNWGDGARLAARSAVHGCLDYLNRAVFGLSEECKATSTREVFVSLLRSIWEGHSCILEVGGALSTLTVAVVLPLSNVNEDNAGKYVVCTCNVGDSLAYVYSKKFGVREITQGSHDITSMRDMRDALGAIGPADGTKPELSNLTLSMTVIDQGDIVFLTSDGISDNFDPVVGKFAEAWTTDDKSYTNYGSHGQPYKGVLGPKRQNKSSSAIHTRLNRNDGNSSKLPTDYSRTKKINQAESGAVAASAVPSRPKYMRSHTVIEPRNVSSSTGYSTSRNSQAISSKIPHSATGLPLVTGPQRHTLTLYRLEDLLSYGINGTLSPCVSARRLCHLLIDFVRMITSARRKTLEQRELFYKLITGPDGIKREVELNRLQHRAARKRVVDSSAFVALPGKLDHATVVAYTVGSITPSENTAKCVNTSLQTKEFQETNF